MTEEEAFERKEAIISDVETLIESGQYTLDDIVEDIQDRLAHLA